MSRIKKFLLAAAASGLTFILAFVAAEIYLRRTTSAGVPPYLSKFYTHDGRQISLQVGDVKHGLAPFTIYKPLPNQHTVRFNINSRGLRDDEGIEQDPRPKIILLGGSATFGQGAETDADTIPAILQQSIKSHRFVNAGVIGFLSGQELTYLVTDLIDYHPALVVAYDGWNDVFDLAIMPARGPAQLGFNSNFFRMEDELVANYRTQISSSASLSRFFHSLSEKSFVLGRFSQSIASRQKQDAPRTIKDLPEAGQKELLAGVVATYVRNVKKMAVFSRASGAKFLVVFQVEAGQRTSASAKEKELLNLWKIGDVPYNDFFPSLYGQFLSAAKPLLTREGIDWIDANESPLFQTDAQTLFVDVVHTNRRGNEVAAQIISEKLLTLVEQK